MRTNAGISLDYIDDCDASTGCNFHVAGRLRGEQLSTQKLSGDVKAYPLLEA